MKKSSTFADGNMNGAFVGTDLDEEHLHLRVEVLSEVVGTSVY